MNQKKQPNMMMRNDTILGVCQSLGEDFGFNPNYLRIALILPLFWMPVEMIALYFGLGLVVLASRTLFPVQGKTAAPQTLPVEANEEAVALPKAA